MKDINFINSIRNIYCVARNYGAHATELGNAIPQSPVLFLKSTSSARTLDDNGKIAYPSETFHHELELIVFIGDNFGSGPSDRLTRIAAIGLGIDVTRREVQTRLKQNGLPWTDAKSFRGAAIFTKPILVTAEPLQAACSEWHRQLSFALQINGVPRQNGRTSEMIFDLPTILSHIESSHGLFPGDVVFTGTPSGVGPLKAGDTMRLTMTLGEKQILDESGIF